MHILINGLSAFFFFEREDQEELGKKLGEERRWKDMSALAIIFINSITWGYK